MKQDFISFAGDQLPIERVDGLLSVKFQDQIVAQAETKEALIEEFEVFRKALVRENSKEFLNPVNSDKDQKNKVIQSWFPFGSEHT